MAKKNLTESVSDQETIGENARASGEASQSPALETVVIALTWQVQNDYTERGVFPELRSQNAQFKRSLTTFYFHSLDASGLILEDATARRDTAKGGLKLAFKSHVENLALAIQEARERPKRMESAEPMCRYKDSHAEDWRGTKQQLIALGICLDGPWPKEPGGKEWTRVRDQRGFPVSLSRDCNIWGFYRAYIELPWKEQVRQESEREEDKARPQLAARAKESLRTIPMSVDEYRRSAIKTLNLLMRAVIDEKPVNYHGYQMTTEGANSIRESLDAVVEAIMRVETVFDPVHHLGIVQQRQADFIATQPSFKTTLAQLTKPNAQLLTGETI